MLCQVLMTMQEDHGPSVRSTVGELRIQNISEAAIDSTGLVQSVQNTTWQQVSTCLGLDMMVINLYINILFTTLHFYVCSLSISTVDDNDVIIDSVRTNFTEQNQPKSSLTSIMSRGELNAIWLWPTHKCRFFLLDYLVFLKGYGLGLDNISFPSQSISWY